MFPPEVLAQMEKWMYDPYGWNQFSRDYLGIKLDNEQDDALYQIRHNPRVAISSGTSRGKDFLMADAATCFMFLTPEWDETGKLVGNTKVILTGPTDRQVKKIIMPEISRIFRQSLYLPGYLSGSGIRTPYDEWYLTAFKADDKNTEAWTGFHAVNIFFGVTEATGMAIEVINAIEGNLQGNSRFVIVFNPNINDGYAADAMDDPSFVKINLNSLNAPNVMAKKIIHPGQVDYNWVIDRIRAWCTPILKKEASLLEADFEFEGQWYRPNDLARAKILGKFPKVSEGVLVPKEWIELANQRWQHNQTHYINTREGVAGTVKEVLIKTKSLRLGVDVAGMGRDSSSFCHRYGPYVDKFEKMHSGGTANHMEVAGIVKNIMKLNTDNTTGSLAQSMIDTIGEGAGVFSRLVELSSAEPTKENNDSKFMHGRVHSCKFSESAEWHDLPLRDRTGQYEFLNMRAYLYWAIRDWLDPDSKTEAALPPDDELKQELTKTMWKFMSNGKIQLEKKEDIKKKLKRSPDKSDSLANTFYPVPDIDPRPAKKKNLGQFFH
jgi:hypothetical protein